MLCDINGNDLSTFVSTDKNILFLFHTISLIGQSFSHMSSPDVGCL